MTDSRDRTLLVTNEPDDVLIARAGDGDQNAAAELIRRHTDKVMGVSYRLLGDRAAAEDVTQETFLKLWRTAASWRSGEAKISTWLYRVASNASLDRLRRVGRERPTEAIPEQVDETRGAEDRLIASEISAAVTDEISRLPARQRQAIVLCHYEGASNIDAAEILGTTVEAVESLLGRARRTLKKRLAGLRAEALDGA